MTKRILTAALTTLSLAALASAALAADETRRGDGVRNRDGGPRVTATPAKPVVSKPVVTATPHREPPVHKPAVVERYQPRGGYETSRTPGIDHRQATQDAMIERGRRNGSITAAEARQLRAEQDRIAELERRAKSDGVVTREERQMLRTTQRDADRHIWQESHDREARNTSGPNRGRWFGWW